MDCIIRPANILELLNYLLFALGYKLLRFLTLRVINACCCHNFWRSYNFGIYILLRF